MENKLKKRNIQRGLIGFFGYFIGNMIYYIIGGRGSYGESLLVSVAIATFLLIIFEGYLWWRKPDEKNAEKILDKDERIIYLRLKATMISSYFLKVLMLGLFLYFAFNDKVRESLYPAILFVVTLLIEWAAYSLYKHRI